MTDIVSIVGIDSSEMGFWPPKPSNITGKKILILGGSGSLGNELTSRYIKDNHIYVFSRGENTQWEMKNKFNSNPNLTFFIGDIRDKARLESCIFQCKPAIIIIASALKQIDTCEKYPNESIETNINGIKIVVDVITQYALTDGIPFLETVVFISTDKACSPVNTYGMCKSVSERMVCSITEFLKKPKFVITRYGNVLTSRGSIIPFFKNISRDKNKSFFPLTDRNMTRYFMTLEESVDLIEYAILKAETGDTVIPKEIRSYKILDLAVEFSKRYNKPVMEIGIRPGEKIDEALISFTEGLRTVEKDNYYIIKPSYMKDVKGLGIEFTSKDRVLEVDSFLREYIT